MNDPRRYLRRTEGKCELCERHRVLHQEPPNVRLDTGQPWIWVCKSCGRMNSAINAGKAICCADGSVSNA